MDARTCPERDFIGVRCYGTVGSLDRVAARGHIIPAFGQPLTFHITAAEDEMLNWLSPGMPISFIRAPAEPGSATATMIRPGGPLLPAARVDGARRNGTSQIVP